MTLLLKSVWRNVLKGSPLGKSLRNRTLSSSIASTEVTRTGSCDAVMSSIMAAPTAAEVLATVNRNMPAMTHKHMLQALRALFELQKSGNLATEPETLVANPLFGDLCQNFKKHARALDVNEAIEATKVLSFLKVPAESVMVQTMLQIIRCYINMINIRQIMFLDYLLTKFEGSNHLVDALKLALPLAFQIHLPLEMDNKDLPMLKDLLAFSCTHDLPVRCIDEIVTALLLHDQAIDAHLAKSLIWSLCQVNCTEDLFPTRAQLLHICYDILSQSIHHLRFEEILSTAARIKGRILEKHPEFYHEQLMDSIANYMVDHKVCFEKGLLVARILSRIAHTHLGLIGYLCEQAASSPTTLSSARPNILFGFINCLSNNNFTPEEPQWENIKRQISKNPAFDGKNNALPWAKICLELASLGYYDDRILKKVFAKENISEFSDKENNVLDYLQLLTLYEAVRTFHNEEYSLPSELLDKLKSVYPLHGKTDLLEEHLAIGLGGPGHVVKNVVLPNGFITDCLICLKGGYPIEFQVAAGDLKVPIEYLNIPKDCIPVCVLNFQPGCFSMNSNRLRGTFRLVLDILENQGYMPVAVNVSEWLAAPAHERTPYLLREVGYKCGEIGMKLAAS